jgi:predicted DNA-binding protein with PD1-like motif
MPVQAFNLWTEFGGVAKIYSLKAGDLIPDAILEIAHRDKIGTARVEAVGGVGKLRLAYFNLRTKKYEEHEFEEYLEVTGMLGNITKKDRKPFLHIHGTFGRRDMNVVGGHIMRATVSTILEVVITPTTNRALRRFDEKTGLNVIYRTF